MKITIFTDGGARGNPGPAGIGVVILRLSDYPIIRLSKYIGTATNNQAEYQAVIEALKKVDQIIIKSDNRDKQDNQGLEIECFLDSELVVEQLNQRYKLKNEGLKPLFWQIREQVVALGGKVTFKYIPREKNWKADKLVNEAIDKEIAN